MIIQMKAIGELREYGNNPRLNDKAVDAVAKSIETFGFKAALVVSADGEIICGHTRLKAAKKLGMQEGPCVIADDLTPEQVKAAPRQRHLHGLHFSTAVCSAAAAQLQIPFYADAVTAKNRARIVAIKN